MRRSITPTLVLAVNGFLVGLAQANGVILPTSTVMFQTALATTSPPRFIQW